MSLRVWLPLNGDLTNNGLSDVTVTNNGATVDNAGKIGKCYYFNASNRNWIQMSMPPEMKTIKNTTVCAWVKSTSSTLALGGISHNGSNNLAGVTLYSSGWQISGQGSSWKYVSAGTIANTSVWHHTCCTIGDDIITTYLDGVKVATSSLTTLGIVTTDISSYNYLEIGCDHPGGDEYMTGYVNDFRIYDHVLSPKEVKLLSQGLVCHYKLSNAFSINNLVRNASYVPYNNYSSVGHTCTVVKTGAVYDGCDIYRMTYTPTATSLSNVQTTLYSHGIYGFISTFKANTKYCFWILWKPISHPDTVVGGIASNIGGWTEIPTKKYSEEWNIVGQYRNGSVTSDKRDNIFTSFKCPSATAGTPIIIDFCCPHLVEGYDYILPENEYQVNDENIVYDCSGYNYHGTKTGDLTLSTDTPRYSLSTHFNGTSYSYLTSISNEIKTISVWAKWDVIPSGQSVIFVDYKSRIGLGLHSGGILCGAASGSYYNFSKANIVANTWYHFVIVSPNGYSDTTRKLYINGVEQTPLTTTSVWSYAIDQLQIGKRSTTSDGFGGKMSDFRLYATALSQEDIQELYNAPVSIADTGTMLTQGEFVEVAT